MSSTLGYRFSSDELIQMCVYKITNKISGKIYIGQTVRKAAERWVSHLSTSKRPESKSGKTLISRTLAKHGEHNFTFEVIDIAENTSSLDHKEIFWINYFNSVAPYGYNLVSGGTKGRVYSEQSRLKMSNSRKKNPSSPRKGVPNSPETRLKISISNRGKISHRRIAVTRNDGKVYQSITEAAKDIFSTGCKISRQINEPYRTVCGFQFKEGIHEPWVIVKVPKKYPVLRSDGVVFDSILEAAISIGASASSIQGVINRRRNSCFGFTFERIKCQDKAI